MTARAELIARLHAIATHSNPPLPKFDIEAIREAACILSTPTGETGMRDALIEMLIEARNQIEYLHGIFQETGTGNAVMARLDDLRHKFQAQP